MKVVDFTAYKRKHSMNVMVNGKLVSVRTKTLLGQMQKPVKQVVKEIVEDIDGQLDTVLQYGYGFNTEGDDDDAA